MLCFTQTTGYAILALGCLEEGGGRIVLAKDIAACTGIPRPYLAKVLRAMRRAGLVEGKRGYRGGFALCRPSSQIKLLEVAEAVEGEKLLGHCLLGLADCSPETACPAHAFWSRERTRIERELRRTTLADVGAFLCRQGTTGAGGCCAPRGGNAGSLPRQAHPATAAPARRCSPTIRTNSKRSKRTGP